MLIPILFVIGLAYVGLSVGRKLQPADFRVGASLPAERRVSYVAMVNQRLTTGRPVTPWLVSEATAEAVARKDWGTVRLLADAFGPQETTTPTASQEQAPTTEVPTPDVEPQEAAAQGPSPLDGVELDDWCAFVRTLATRDVGYRSERHTGKYEQNLSRLRQLGIAPPQGEEDEYKALVADMTDYWEGEQDLIHGSAGEVVKLRGEDVAVTPSGILGLLKSAGPAGARSWLGNDGDRERFPRTTEAFLRTNGNF